jgi:hypothetical protein
MAMHSILDRITEANIKRDLFPHAVVENALPEDYYEELAACFPTLESVAGAEGIANNKAYRKLALQTLDDPEIPAIWRDFVAYHSSRAFLDRVCDVWGADIEATHPDLAENFGKPLSEFTVGIRHKGKEENAQNLTHDMMMDCQFSFNSPVTKETSVRGPHLDSPYKLFAALLYFRDPNDRSTGGDFTVYRLKEGDALKPRPAKINPRYVEPIYSVPYRANTLVFFINSPAAIHGVTPRTITDTSRRYMNFLGECYRGQSSEYFIAGNTPVPGFWPTMKRLWKRSKAGTAAVSGAGG